ncbi:tRNA (N(6)-L-threonylcarbamoyladenosine(37)-C(2))-methylthiotransferase MtaB [bacterium]|nr:tRNA (N(6)-L-threonylcarbamoyladenosine(37)-C(2))-methylthiotransferase MtaB [bacterium]
MSVHDESHRTAAVMTVGCKLNQYEGEGIAELLENDGFDIVPFSETADVYVVNTCTVTMRSDYRSRQMLRRASRINPSAVLIATGCYAQREPERLAEMPEVDLVVGNSDKAAIPQLAAEHLALKAQQGETELSQRPISPERAHPSRTVVRPLTVDHFEPLDIVRFRGHTRAFLKIQEGCDRRCSYCAVPDARGPSRSRPLAEVLTQTRTLAENGYREVVLTGVHIGAYDSDGVRLSHLLRKLVTVDGLDRIRLGSIEPLELTTELADTIVELDTVCDHLHVPLQSGSDDILAAMRRGHSASEYEEIVRRVTDRLPHAGLGADVMVGFPGETEADFSATIDLIERLPFTYLHVFAYSPRSGTPAAEITESLSGVRKKERSRTLKELSAQKSLAFRTALVGSEIEILVEKGDQSTGNLLTGLSDSYVRVELTGPESLKNHFVRVLVESVDGGRTRGTMIRDSAR